ncbi:MAG: MFS transporter [Lachnospiraceae bacterium]|nr:MFS transporter [Lachnospiraceae bacterium]
MELKMKNKNLFLIAVLLLGTGTQFFNYGCNTAMTPLLKEINGYHLYSLAAALGSTGTMVALPAVGALGGKAGRRNIIVIGAAIMLACMVGTYFTYDPYLFMVLRFLSSLGSGLVMSAPFSIIGTVWDRQQAMKYYGFISTFNAVGALCGPLAAGALVDAGMGRLPFFLWVPFYVFAVAVICMAYPNVKQETGSKFDVLGLFYLACTVVPLILWLGLSGDGKPLAWAGPGLILPVVVIVFAVLLTKHSAKLAHPTVPLRMFKQKRFRTAFFINMLVVCFSTVTSGYVLNYILYSMNRSTTVGSTSTMPMNIVLVICGLFMGSILRKNFVKNVRTMMLIGTLALLAGLSCYSLLQPDSPMLLVWIGSAVGGLGNSMNQTCMTPFFQYGLPKEDFAAAQGMYQFSSTGMASIFVPFVGVFVNMTGSIKPVFYIATILAAVNVVLVFCFVKITKEEEAQVEGRSA